MLYLFVEGPDDKRLINCLFSNVQDKQFYEYSKKKQSCVSNLLKTINNTPGWQYIFFADSDTKSIEQKKRDIKNKWNDLDENKIVIVCIEIESWYYAGMSQELCEKYKIKYQTDSNNVYKEQFITLIAKSRRTKTEILIEAASAFDIVLARQRNESFNLFCNDYL